MIKIIIIVVIVLILIAGGVLSGMAVLGMGGPLAGLLPELTEAPKIELGSTKPMAVNIDPMAVPVIQDGEVVRQVTLNFRVMVERRNAPSFFAIQPRLFDAYFKDLIIFLPIHLRDRDEVDVEALKRRVLIVSQKMFGEPLVKDVEFTAISYQ